jgi:hypothetical protein
MSLTLAIPVATARSILNDTDPTAYRYSDADLLQYGNDALDQMVTLVPSLFYVEGEMECVAGALQALNFADARALVVIRNIKDGAAIIPANKPTLDLFDPSWISGTAGAAKNWMGVEGDPVRFYLYPPSPNGQTLNIIYIRNPQEYTSSQDTGLPPVYTDAIADYIVYRAESRDDESVVSQRAQAFYQSFVNKCSGG